MTLEENIEIIKWAYYENNGEFSVRHYTKKYFPALANIDDEMPQNEVYKIIEDIVTKEYYEYKSRIEEETKRYNGLWEKYNDLYLSTLSNYLEIMWPLDLNNIKAKVGLIPVFPRYLDDFSFSVCTGLNDSKLIEICAHETLHFLWFEKWKSIYPETPRREYDSPYITWKYSEMVTDPILNNKPFKDMFDFVERGYDSFYEIHDGENLVMDNLRQIYSENIKITEKIENGFNYVKQVLEINQNKK